MKTIKLRVKDKHARLLNEMAAEVNLVWNYANELSYTHLQRTGKFFSAYDIAGYCAGATKGLLKIHSFTVQATVEELVYRRIKARKAKLRWRSSNPKSPRRSLGWIPFKSECVRIQAGQVSYRKQWYSLWDSYGLNQFKGYVKGGCFTEDSRGRWYVCLYIQNEIPEKQPLTKTSVGIDLGLKDFATLSDGRKIEAPRFFRADEEKLAIAQRAHKKARIKAIHAKIKNRRADFLHKLSTKLTQDHDIIVVGDVNPSRLNKTRMAKSVMDASWTTFRTMLSYKSQQAGAWFLVVNEAYTTQICSCCGSSQDSPKGRADLGIREWLCRKCGTLHDRDINSANNILALGHERLAGGVVSC